MTLAHIGGLPIEETLGSLGPALLVGLGVAWANLRAGLRRVRSHAHAPGAVTSREQLRSDRQIDGAKAGMRTRFGEPVNRATAARGLALTLACLLGLLVLADSAPARRGEALLVNQANGVAGNAGSDSPSISADGRFVAFESGADNLSSGDDNDFSNIFVRDVQAGTTTLASHNDGIAADGDSEEASISANGRFVAFESRADNLSAGDDNSFTNVFRQDLRGPVPVCSDVAETVPQGGVATVTLPCRDDDGDPITRTVVSSPAHGKLGPVDQATGTVSYMPDPGYTGPDSFSFQGSDASGSSAPASASLTVTATQPIVAFGTDTLVTLTLARARIPGKGPVAVRVSNANDFPVSGKLSGRTAKRVPTSAQRRRVTLNAKRFQVADAATRTVRLRLPKSLRRALQRQRKLALRLTATLRDPAGNTRTVRQTLRPRLRARTPDGRVTR